MGQVVDLQRLSAEHRSQARFLFVYISEAHPNERIEIPLGGEPYSVCLGPTNDVEERRARARELREDFGFTVQAVVDDPTNRVAGLYGAWPARAVVIGADGTILHKFGGRSQGVSLLADRVRAALASPTGYEVVR